MREQGAELKNENFVSINGRYGFDQNMLKASWSKYYVDRSCGLSALGNTILYTMGKYFLEEEEASMYLQRLAKQIRPRPWGIPRIGRLNRGLKKFSKTLRIESYKGKKYGPEARSYVYENLKRDRPVLLMNTNHPNKAFRYHWVTITGLKKEGGQWQVYFSSWGRRYKLSFDELFSSKTIFRSMGVMKIIR